MAYKRLKGIPGRIYIPDTTAAAPKKHPCPDCFACQWCPEDRCRSCRKAKTCKHTAPPRTHRKS